MSSVHSESALITVIKTDTPQDLADAYAVRIQVFVNEQKVDPDTEIEPEDDLAYHWVAYQTTTTPIAKESEEQSRKPIGTVRLLPSSASPSSAKLGRLAVLKECRGQGIGRLLMQHLEAYAKSIGLKRIYMHAQSDKIAFYQALGYTVYDDTVFYEENIAHVKMERLF
ncbi:acyl-CoA N-acyltransferase [Syncephalis plumigaleata]|nr:acyl-CoA N-acyltransferase [Syncephalis plumigaleata]